MVYAGISKKALNAFLTLEDEVIAVHNGKYSYEHAVYINARVPFLITCPTHGDFLQRPSDHKQGKGCRKCFDKKISMINSKSKDAVDAEIRELMDTLFVVDYSFVYSGNASLVHVKCKTCGAEFDKTVGGCISGESGCIECFRRNVVWGPERYKNVPAILYYIEIGGLFKIGITTRSVTTRYSKELRAGFNLKTIFTIDYEDGAEAYKEEQRVLKQYCKHRYYGEKVLLSGGDSELFTTDIFEKGYNNDQYKI